MVYIPEHKIMFKGLFLEQTLDLDLIAGLTKSNYFTVYFPIRGKSKQYLFT